MDQESGLIIQNRYEMVQVTLEVDGELTTQEDVSDDADIVELVHAAHGGRE
jgi:hypothetical protein